MNEVKVPSITSNEDTVCLVEVLIDKNQKCKPGDILCTLESTKTTFELIAEEKGYVWFISNEGSDVITGEVIAFISSEPIDKKNINDSSLNIKKPDETDIIMTKKAEVLINNNNVNPIDIKNNGIIKEIDVKKFLDIKNKSKKDKSIYDDFEEIMKSQDINDESLDDLIRLKKSLLLAQKIYSDKWNRNIPSIDSLFDRWSAGENYGFGKESNISHLSYVIGDVVVGSQTFIGPFTMLDGSGGLEIGSYCSIAAGVQVYSHDTISRALSSYKQNVSRSPTKIGDSCFIGANTVITKGVKIGDRCLIGANSVISFNVPSNSVVLGNPAKITGKVIINKDGLVKIRKTDS
jgi:acetyltransferase-like isoleucine patch superfamily enzyme